jgi:tetratricopeptide (TPR) repeat protein
MEMNPIMERVIRLSEQWKSVLTDYPDARVFCWMGNSMSEYKMIRGLVLFHMSEESTLEDIFIACHLPFDSQSAGQYGKNTLEMMDAYVRSWNKDEKLSSENGTINWTVTYDEKQNDVFNFVSNMNQLAKSFSCDAKEKKLVVCILPQRLDDLDSFRQWITEILKSPVHPSVCYMLYDTYDSRLFGKFEKEYPLLFRYIIPDMDLYGAINQILEDKKQEESGSEAKDMISYQQLLLKLTEATGQGDEKRALSCAEQAIEKIRNYQLPHMEALIYYLLHSMYVSINNKDKAADTLDKALEFSRKAVEQEIPGSRMTCCQYLITKANTYFINKKHEKALQFYLEALSISERDCALEIRISIYQMMGTCKRIAGDFYSLDTFVEGWKLAEKLDEQQLKAHLPLRYYALEMLKSGNSKETYQYQERFASLWGENWEKDIKQMEKEQRQRMSVVS